MDTKQSTQPPPPMRRPTVYYPATRLASSRQTYNVRRRSQSQGVSTDDLIKSLRHRHSGNPDSDSEYSSSELSTSTHATTVASDDEYFGSTDGKHNKGTATPRPSATQARDQQEFRDASVLDPRAPQFVPEASSRGSSVQFSEPLESSVHSVTPRLSSRNPTRQQPPRPLRDAPSVPPAPRPTRLSEVSHQLHNRSQSESRRPSQAHLPGSFPEDVPVVRRARAEHILLDNIEQLKKQTDNLQLQQTKSSKEMEDTLMRLTNLQVDKEAAVQISNQEKQLREGLAHELDEQERVIEELEQTVNETVRQLQTTSQQLVTAEQGVNQRDAIEAELEHLKTKFTEASNILVDVQNEREQLKKALDEALYQNGQLKKDMEQIRDEKQGKETYFLARVSCLENEKDTLGIKVETMETAQKTHEMQYGDLVKENAVLEVAVEKLEERATGLEKEKAALEEVNQGLKAAMEGLEEDKKSLRAQIEGLEQDKKSLQTQVESLERDKTELQAKVAAVEDEKKDLAERMEGLEGTNKDLQDQVARLDQGKTDLNARIDVLEAEKKDLEGRISSLDAEINNITGEKDEFKAKLNTLEAERMEAEKEFDDMEGEIEDLKKQIDVLQSDKEEIKSHGATAAEEKEKLEGQIKELEEQIEQAKAQRDADTMAHAAQVTLSGSLTAERDTLKMEIDALKKDLDSLKASVADKDAEIENPRDAKTPTESDIDNAGEKTADPEPEPQEKDAPKDLSPDIATLQTTLTEKEALIIDKDAQIATLTTEKDALSADKDSQISTLTTERTELEAKVTDCQATITNLEAKVVTLNQTADQVPGLLEQNTTLNTHLTTATAHISNLTSQLATANHHLEEYKAAHDLATSEVAKLQRLVAQLKTKLESRSPTRKKPAVRVRQEDLVMVRNAEKGTFQVVKKADIRPSRSPSASRSTSDSS